MSLKGRLILFGALFGVGVLAGTAYAGAHYLTHSPRFRVRRIEFARAAHVPQDELRRAVERHRGRNLFRLDLRRLERDLEACRWVKRAAVTRVLPDGLRCSVEERVPRGLALLKGRVVLVDGEGAVIDAYDARTRAYSFPIFTGLDEKDPGRAAAQIARGLALLDYLDAHHPRLPAEISGIDLGRDDRLELRLNEGGPAVRLHPQEFGTNLERYLTMRRYLATHFGDGAYVDLRFKDRIAFKPAIKRGH
jgi:cell division septal protein FtsQ